MKTILTVDDSPTMRKVIALALSASGHRILEAGDGVAAIEVLRTEHVDLIITDVNRPRMDGIELETKKTILKKLRHCLRVQGSLLLGSSETTTNLDRQWAPVPIGFTVVYRPTPTP